MRLYIEAFREDGTQIFGNLDGQRALGTLRMPTRSAHVSRLYGNERPRYSRVFEWRIVREDGRIVQRIRNKQYGVPK